MLSVELALRLRAAGLRWSPHRGDRFVLPHRGMDDEVFVLSDMTVDVHEFPTGRVIGFNGVTEWALDSVDQREAVWLPGEHQLRELLGGLFVRLQRNAAGSGDGASDGAGGDPSGYTVTVRIDGQERQVSARDAEDAYGQALLQVIGAVRATSR